MGHLMSIVVHHDAVVNLHGAAKDVNGVLRGPVRPHVRLCDAQTRLYILVFFLLFKLDEDCVTTDFRIDLVGHRVDKAALASIIREQDALVNDHYGFLNGKDRATQLGSIVGKDRVLGIELGVGDLYAAAPHRSVFLTDHASPQYYRLHCIES